MIRGIGPRRSGVPVSFPRHGGRLKRFAARAGAVVLIVVALDLVATAATLALGVRLIKP